MLAIWINLRAFIMLSTETVPQRHYRLFTKPAADSETGENISELNLGPKQNQRTISHYKATLYRERESSYTCPGLTLRLIWESPNDKKKSSRLWTTEFILISLHNINMHFLPAGCYAITKQWGEKLMLFQSNDKCLTMHQDDIIMCFTNWSLIHKLNRYTTDIGHPCCMSAFPALFLHANSL